MTIGSEAAEVIDFPDLVGTPDPDQLWGVGSGSSSTPKLRLALERRPRTIYRTVGGQIARFDVPYSHIALLGAHTGMGARQLAGALAEKFRREFEYRYDPTMGPRVQYFETAEITPKTTRTMFGPGIHLPKTWDEQPQGWIRVKSGSDASKVAMPILRGRSAVPIPAGIYGGQTGLAFGAIDGALAYVPDLNPDLWFYVGVDQDQAGVALADDNGVRFMARRGPINAPVADGKLEISDLSLDEDGGFEIRWRDSDRHQKVVVAYRLDARLGGLRGRPITGPRLVIVGLKMPGWKKTYTLGDGPTRWWFDLSPSGSLIPSAFMTRMGSWVCDRNGLWFYSDGDGFGDNLVAGKKSAARPTIRFVEDGSERPCIVRANTKAGFGHIDLKDIGGEFQTFALDWLNHTVFVECSWPFGIGRQVRGLWDFDFADCSIEVRAIKTGELSFRSNTECIRRLDPTTTSTIPEAQKTGEFATGDHFMVGPLCLHFTEGT
jgi:hypothetical protein